MDPLIELKKQLPSLLKMSGEESTFWKAFNAVETALTEQHARIKKLEELVPSEPVTRLATGKELWSDDPMYLGLRGIHYTIEDVKRNHSEVHISYEHQQQAIETMSMMSKFVLTEWLDVRGNRLIIGCPSIRRAGEVRLIATRVHREQQGRVAPEQPKVLPGVFDNPTISIGSDEKTVLLTYDTPGQATEAYIELTDERKER